VFILHKASAYNVLSAIHVHPPCITMPQGVNYYIICFKTVDCTSFATTFWPRAQLQDRC